MMKTQPTDSEAETIRELARERVKEELDEYTTMGEIRTLVREVLHSDEIRVQMKAKYENEIPHAIAGTVEAVKDELESGLLW